MIDLAIVGFFLIATLVVGLGHGQRVKTIKDYALGGRNFSTAALVATIVATWASGSGFFITLSKTYYDGFYYLFLSFGISISLIITSFVLVPRMGEFLGKISIAEAMGELYGNKVRFIVAITGTIGLAGFVAVQFKAFGMVVSYYIGIPSMYAIIISGIIATIYSAFGGIRSVTFTDLLQGVAFGVIIPLLGFAIWSKFFNSGYSLETSFANPKFDINSLFDVSDINFWSFIFLFLYFLIPPVSGAFFQRIAMGSSLQQVKKAFFIAALIFVVIEVSIVWIPFLVHSMNPNIEPNNLLPYIVDTYSFTGLKGLIIVAIIAFAMSTADSMINSSSVLFTHDIYGLFAKNEKKELSVARIFACFLGGGTMFLSLIETDLLGVIIFANSFYYPLVTPPFLLTVFGFRSSSKSVLIGMFVGLFVTISWHFLPSGFLPVSQNIIGVLFAMFCNSLFLFGSHYALKQSGGWVGIKNNTYFEEQKLLKLQKLEKKGKWYSEFSFKKFCKKIAPHNEITYTSLGLYFIACTVTTMYSTQVELLGSNAQLMKIIYPFMLVSGTVIAMYPLWPLSIAKELKESVIQNWYPFAIFYMLIFFSCFFVLVSKLDTLQIALFSINLMVASLLLGWRMALPSILVGFYFAIEFYQYFFGASGFAVQLGSPEFILIYTLLFLASAIMFFLKPRQVQEEETVEKVGTLEVEVTHLGTEITDLNEKIIYYNERISDQAKEIERLGATAQKILNNVNHELRLPVGNVMNFAEMLNEGLGKFDEDQLKMLSDEVFKNSTRLSTMILNMLDLATLSSEKFELDLKIINLGELVEDRINNCRKIYLEDKKIDFVINIHPEIFVSVDPNYMRQVVDNIMINAIKFTEEGVIKIVLLKKSNFIELTVTDSGIGIPQKDLYSIFTPFKMGSNTESKAEGRGVGLALCKTAIEAHGGVINVESPGGKGARFKIVLKTR